MQLAARDRVLQPATQPLRPKAVARKHDARARREAVRARRSTVLVLNGNGRTGAAAAAASRVHSRGYRIGDVDERARARPAQHRHVPAGLRG